MTLSGVPSYDWWNPLSWEWTGDDGILSKAGDWLGYGGDDGGGKLVKDLASLGGGYLGYKEAEELSDWEKQQYEQQKVQEALNTALFAAQTDEGKQLLEPKNVPETDEDGNVVRDEDGNPVPEREVDPTGVSTVLAGVITGSYPDLLPSWMPTAGVIFLPTVGEAVNKVNDCA